MNFKRILYILLLSSISLIAEPSVYGFDNDYIDENPNIAVDSNNIEIVDRVVDTRRDSYRDNIYVNRREPQTAPTIASLQAQLKEQNERIDGLTTVIEGLSSSLNELQHSTTTTTNIPMDTVGDNIDLVDDVIIDESPSIVSSLPKRVVTKPSYTTPVVNTPAPLSSKSNNLLFSEGVTNFLNKRYSAAKERFLLTDSKNYKVATSNYYLGEISYYTQKYEDAIFFYKKSAGIDDKTSYIDTLLLHTGISFEKSGNIKKAKGFYQNIIDNYPNNKTANIAREKLRKM